MVILFGSLADQGTLLNGERILGDCRSRLVGHGSRFEKILSSVGSLGGVFGLLVLFTLLWLIDLFAFA